MLNMFMYLLLLIMLMVSIAFFTLIERKILGYIHVRKGPVKVGFYGILQPFSDVIKLFIKGMNSMWFMNSMLYLFMPCMALFLMFMFWVMMVWGNNQILLENGIIYFLCISSLGVYVIMFSGWASNSKYSLLGGLRGLAQVISYEVGMAMILLSLILMVGSYSIYYVIEYQLNYFFLGGFFISFVMWFVSCLAETNRSPFDLSEGESELVSGFNIEYGSYSFAILFMAEYGCIMYVSALSCIMFIGSLGKLCCYMMLMIYLFIVIRGTLVRFRYDNLMLMAWSMILPVSINLFIVCFYMKNTYMYFLCIKFSKTFSLLF
uniref:NADH-ubiquinone oxidoreductase chain 1 n=1 Tax=Chiropterargas boueti TaxID=1827022 RepID=A0A1P8AG44_9ACAR|nr:NADH dehydrogenase subunit 1 [Chiropterargas boueti]AMX74078.1 NADH dehydrogenase subunit 1 [Chiropterargas boueti]AMX74091.1 NADH dehydrogenase subunit 1 [Chiropterargas boueti]